MLPHWGNQPQYSSESAGDTGDTISGPSVTVSSRLRLNFVYLLRLLRVTDRYRSIATLPRLHRDSHR
jgi:hypothetical protein